MKDTLIAGVSDSILTMLFTWSLSQPLCHTPKGWGGREGGRKGGRKGEKEGRKEGGEGGRGEPESESERG